MKKMNYFLYLLLSFFVLSSCSKKEVAEVNDLISVSEGTLDKQQKRAVESMRKFLIDNRMSMTRSSEGLPQNYLKPEELEKVTFTTIPYCVLDTSFISSDLDHNNLEKYIRPSKSMYLGKLDGNFALLVDLQKVGDTMWVPGFNLEGTEYFKKVFGWLVSELNVASKKDFFILQVFGLKYIVYYTAEGDPVFCNFPGNIRMDKLDFFKHVIRRYNTIKDAQEAMKEWNNTGKGNLK